MRQLIYTLLFWLMSKLASKFWLQEISFASFQPSNVVGNLKTLRPEDEEEIAAALFDLKRADAPGPSAGAGGGGGLQDWSASNGRFHSLRKRQRKPVHMGSDFQTELDDGHDMDEWDAEDEYLAKRRGFVSSRSRGAAYEPKNGADARPMMVAQALHQYRLNNVNGRSSQGKFYDEQGRGRGRGSANNSDGMFDGLEARGSGVSAIPPRPGYNPLTRLSHSNPPYPMGHYGAGGQYKRGPNHVSISHFIQAHSSRRATPGGVGQRVTIPPPPHMGGLQPGYAGIGAAGRRDGGVGGVPSYHGPVYGNGLPVAAPGPASGARLYPPGTGTAFGASLPGPPPSHFQRSYLQPQPQPQSHVSSHQHGGGAPPPNNPQNNISSLLPTILQGLKSITEQQRAAGGPPYSAAPASTPLSSLTGVLSQAVQVLQQQQQQQQPQLGRAGLPGAGLPSNPFQKNQRPEKPSPEVAGLLQQLLASHNNAVNGRSMAVDQRQSLTGGYGMPRPSLGPNSVSQPFPPQVALSVAMPNGGVKIPPPVSLPLQVPSTMHIPTSNANTVYTPVANADANANANTGLVSSGGPALSTAPQQQTVPASAQQSSSRVTPMALQALKALLDANAKRLQNPTQQPGNQSEGTGAIASGGGGGGGGVEQVVKAENGDKGDCNQPQVASVGDGAGDGAGAGAGIVKPPLPSLSLALSTPEEFVRTLKATLQQAQNATQGNLSTPTTVKEEKPPPVAAAEDTNSVKEPGQDPGPVQVLVPAESEGDVKKNEESGRCGEEMIKASEDKPKEEPIPKDDVAAVAVVEEPKASYQPATQIPSITQPMQASTVSVQAPQKPITLEMVHSLLQKYAEKVPQFADKLTEIGIDVGHVKASTSNDKEAKAEENS